MNFEKLQSQDISAPKALENKQHIELPDDSGRRAGKKELPGDTGADFQKEKQSLENIDRQELTDTDRTQMKEISGWTDKITDYIGSWKEFEIYRNAGLVEAQIGDKHCLIRNDINWEQKDGMGRTNKERAEQGLSPINKDGKVIELHHIGQHADSPYAELTPEEHRGKGNDTVLHDKTKESEIDRTAFAGERSKYWKERSETELNFNG